MGQCHATRLDLTSSRPRPSSYVWRTQERSWRTHERQVSSPCPRCEGRAWRPPAWWHPQRPSSSPRNHLPAFWPARPSTPRTTRIWRRSRWPAWIYLQRDEVGAVVPMSTHTPALRRHKATPPRATTWAVPRSLWSWRPLAMSNLPSSLDRGYLRRNFSSTILRGTKAQEELSRRSRVFVVDPQPLPGCLISQVGSLVDGQVINSRGMFLGASSLEEAR